MIVRNNNNLDKNVKIILNSIKLKIEKLLSGEKNLQLTKINKLNRNLKPNFPYV